MKTKLTNLFPEIKDLIRELRGRNDLFLDLDRLEHAFLHAKRMILRKSQLKKRKLELSKQIHTFNRVMIWAHRLATRDMKLQREIGQGLGRGRGKLPDRDYFPELKKHIYKLPPSLNRILAYLDDLPKLQQARTLIRKYEVCRRDLESYHESGQCEQDRELLWQIVRVLRVSARK